MYIFKDLDSFGQFCQKGDWRSWNWANAFDLVLGYGVLETPAAAHTKTPVGNGPLPVMDLMIMRIVLDRTNTLQTHCKLGDFPVLHNIVNCKVKITI
jgi:hypothetical protein